MSELLEALAMKEPLHRSFRHLQGAHAYLEETEVPHDIICVQSKAIPVLVHKYEASPVCMASGTLEETFQKILHVHKTI